MSSPAEAAQPGDVMATVASRRGGACADRRRAHVTPPQDSTHHIGAGETRGLGSDHRTGISTHAPTPCRRLDLADAAPDSGGPVHPACAVGVAPAGVLGYELVENRIR